MYVVSGCPRSGTSLMMDLLRVTFGEDRILGKKFPQEEILHQQNGESDNQYKTRTYVINKTRDKEEKKFHDMNPNGFWEMMYTVKGVYYRFNDIKRLEKILNEDKPSICKIVSQGLIRSDPKYITKIIYMIRHPRAVAKSQENLKRQAPLDDISIGGEKLKIHTPEMYINVTSAASRWLFEYKDVPVYFVHFDDLIENPNETLLGIQDFLGEGDFTNAIKQINPKLRRSYPQEIKHDFWEDAEKIYELFLQKKFKDIINYINDPNIKFNSKNRTIFCTRLMEPKHGPECESCKSNRMTRKNFKNRANQKNINWENEPCIYECTFNDLTIEQSIENNFWKENIKENNVEFMDLLFDPQSIW